MMSQQLHTCPVLAGQHKKKVFYHLKQGKEELNAVFPGNLSPLYACLQWEMCL